MVFYHTTPAAFAVCMQYAFAEKSRYDGTLCGILY